MTKRQVFYSFHYQNDNWRVHQVIEMGMVEGNQMLNPNDWETVKNKGDENIKTWIKNELAKCSCLVVLIGTETAERKWVKYEIIEAWNMKKGVCGIDIHLLKDRNGNPSNKGKNPFNNIVLSNSKKSLSDIVPLFESQKTDSKGVYADIKENIVNYVEMAINIRSSYP